jgi:hypothetical protein
VSESRTHKRRQGARASRIAITGEDDDIAKRAGMHFAAAALDPER